VSANRLAILNRLQRPETDAHYMPISRDLSTAKKNAIIAWLTNVGADGKPLFAPPRAPALAGRRMLGKADRAQRLA
jgi:hypothetical protein